MSTILSLTKRNCKLFFKDKGLFLTSLITPLILLVLYASFLSNVYKDVFSQILVGLDVPEKIINGAVVGQLTSSLLAVCCVTVSFCSNLLMLQDKVNGVKNDLLMTPATKTQMAISYYFSTVISTLLICYTAMSVCIIYCGIVGFYMTLLDVFLIVIDVLILNNIFTAPATNSFTFFSISFLVWVSFFNVSLTILTTSDLVKLLSSSILLAINCLNVFSFIITFFPIYQ